MYKKDRSAKIEKGLNQTSSADSLFHMNEKEAGEAREILRRRLAEKPEIQELLKNHRSKEKTMDNLSVLQDTLQIFENGYYYVNGQRKNLKLSPGQYTQAKVILPGELCHLLQGSEENRKIYSCTYLCENLDSYAMAEKLSTDSDIPVLVLNLANPVNPGGGVRKGAKAQEEDLCRRSSLLLSLESEEARAYYRYNKSLHTYMGSDALILTPHTEVIKRPDGSLLEDSLIVSVLTCAAPMITYGKEGMSEEEYTSMVAQRIRGMLCAAICFGYTRLVLGAWGCGAFSNDARVISDLFAQVLQSSYGDHRLCDYFEVISFAVLDHSTKQYNYREFARNFGGKDVG